MKKKYIVNYDDESERERERENLTRVREIEEEHSLSTGILYEGR